MQRVFLDGHLLTVLAISCNLQVSASNCKHNVFGKRSQVFAPEGGSVSLACKIQHCGLDGWTGGWHYARETHPTPLNPSPRHNLSNYTENANTSHLLLTIQNLNQSDSGSYQCIIQWSVKLVSNGHVTIVNVTTSSYGNFADPISERRLDHRLLVCGAAGLCFLLALGLAYCLSPPSSPRTPAVPLRYGGSPTVRVQPKADVVYTVVNVDRKSPARAPPFQDEAVVYSAMIFSPV